jgi:hypothetical protein
MGTRTTYHDELEEAMTHTIPVIDARLALLRVQLDLQTIQQLGGKAPAGMLEAIQEDLRTVRRYLEQELAAHQAENRILDLEAIRAGRLLQPANKVRA